MPFIPWPKRPTDLRAIFRRSGPRTDRPVRFPRWARRSLIGFGAVIIVIIGTSLPFALQAVGAAKDGKAALERAQVLAREQEFAGAQTALDEAALAFSESQKGIDRLIILKVLPVAKTQLAAADHLLEAGIQLTTALKRLLVWVEKTLTALGSTDVRISSLAPEQTRELLRRLYEAEPDLQGIKAQVDLARQAADHIPRRGLLAPVRKVVTPFRAQLEDLQESVSQLVPLSRFLPPLAGYPEPKTYLFLLQNNTELRPTGGFIGTYGILTLRDGQITSFRTDNAYNLDLKVRGVLKVAPPEPLAKYNFSEGWFFRDSNWSPDFPTAARQALWFYRQEGGTGHVDGVIAVTPTFVSSLLKHTGPLDVNGTKVDAKNLVEFLRFQVDEGYLREGLPESERKEIVGLLTGQLLEKLLGLEASRWPDVFQTIEENTKEKQIFVYLENSELQALASAVNWSGEIRSTPDDFLFVVDANIGSLKSDPFVQRSLAYTVHQEGSELQATLEITYDHQGELSKTVTRYRTYTRVYVPKGSELISADGPMIRCQDARLGTVKTEEEFDRAVFGFFSCTEPKERRTVRLTYRLPPSLLPSPTDAGYALLVQKQGGTSSYPLTVTLDLTRSVGGVALLDSEDLEVENNKTIRTNLEGDRTFTFTLNH